MKINSCLVKAVGMFSFGVAVGSVTTNIMLKTKYERITIEEIDSYREKILAQAEGGEIMDEDEIPFDLKMYEEEKSEVVIGDYTKKMNESKKNVNMKPYKITLEEFDTIDDYELVGVGCFNDENLDDDDNRIEDIDDVIDFLKNEQEVYVRDEVRKIDYHLKRYDEDYYVS